MVGDETFSLYNTAEAQTVLPHVFMFGCHTLTYINSLNIMRLKQCVQQCVLSPIHEQSCSLKTVAPQGAPYSNS